MSMSSLNRRADKLLAAIEQRQEQDTIEFVCYWADEPIPPGQGRIITTEWSNVLDEEED